MSLSNTLYRSQLCDRDRALECLARLAPWRADDRDQWLRVGMILHSVSPDLLGEYDAWSRQSEKYRPGECQRQWKGFKADGGIGLGSLIAWANEDDPSGSGKATASQPTQRAKSAPSSNASKPKQTYPTIEAAVQALERQTGGTYEAAWTYHNADGDEAMQVVRLKTQPAPGKKPKTYRPVHPVVGGYALADPDGLLPLYGLTAVLQADVVAVFEGEKLCDLAAGIGLTATTSAHGAQSAKRTDWTPLAGKAVTIYPDHDEGGERYAADVATILRALYPPATVRIVDLPGLAEAEDFEQWLALHHSQAPAETLRALQALPSRQPPVEPEQQAGLICVVGITDILNAPPMAWQASPVVPKNGFVVFFGASGSGKSFVVQDLGLSIASGQPWLGRHPLQQGPVVYVAGEGVAGLKQRTRAWMLHHGVEAEQLVDYFVVPQPVNFMQPDDVDLLCRSISTATSNRAPAVVVLDTLARCLVGGNENAAEDMGDFIGNVGRLQTHYGCACIVVHHCGWNESRTRGSSSLKGAVDMEFRVEASGQTMTLTCTKSKDAEEPPPIYLQRKVFALPEGGTSCVVEPLSKADVASEMSDFERRVLDFVKQNAGARNKRILSEFVETRTGPRIMGKSTLHTVLGRLVQSGKVLKDGKGKDTKYYPGTSSESDGDDRSKVQD